MTEHTSLKTLKKQSKSQVKALEKAIYKAVKKRLKSQAIEQVSLDEMNQVDIDELANTIAMQLLPTKSQPTSNDTEIIDTVSPINAKPSSMSFALTPYKNSPCKQCPAKSGGLCACAVKAKKHKKVS
ncbi:hypothetical protein ACMAZF_04810 [Psychrobium sp. nBUS_13]|uniref:hypothetical protein n=1 Tax=Psychrobium sp. nBUS_13 TaxID=3395319 RepID=UPI003EBCF9FE